MSGGMEKCTWVHRCMIKFQSVEEEEEDCLEIPTRQKCILYLHEWTTSCCGIFWSHLKKDILRSDVLLKDHIIAEKTNGEYRIWVQKKYFQIPRNFTSFAFTVPFILMESNNYHSSVGVARNLIHMLKVKSVTAKWPKHAIVAVQSKEENFNVKPKSRHFSTLRTDECCEGRTVIKQESLRETVYKRFIFKQIKGSNHKFWESFWHKIAITVLEHA